MQILSSKFQIFDQDSGLYDEDSYLSDLYLSFQDPDSGLSDGVLASLTQIPFPPFKILASILISETHQDRETNSLRTQDSTGLPLIRILQGRRAVLLSTPKMILCHKSQPLQQGK